MKEYDIIYSIGRDCACSSYLQTNSLRICSGPLDWLTSATFEQRFDMLLNDFDGFMNKEDFQPLAKPSTGDVDNENDYYRNIRSGFDFYHDFTSGVPFDTVFDAVADKYNRRIERFYNNIMEKRRVLLVFLSLWSETPDEIIYEKCKKFCTKMGKKIDFLIIEHKDGQMKPLRKGLASNITRYYLHARALDGSNEYTGNRNLINKIFVRYRVKGGGMPSGPRLYWLRFQKRVLCSLIPVKKWRHNARQHLRRKLRPEQDVPVITPPPPGRHLNTTTDANLLVYTYANQKYYDFAILYPIWVLASNKDAIIEIALDNLDAFVNKYRHLVDYYYHEFAGRVKFTQIDKKFRNVPAGTVRFISQPVSRAKYVYIGDIDILVLDDICRLHVSNITENELDFSNIKRRGIEKLSGLHFIEYDKMYPLNMNGIDIYADNDENVLYKLMCNKGYKIPDENIQTYRPLCGIHISYFSRPPLKTLTTNDQQTDFPCWYDNCNNERISSEIDKYNNIRNSDTILQFYSRIRQDDVDLRRIIQFIDLFVYYITTHPQLLGDK